MKFKNLLKKYVKFTSFDIALMGMMMAMYFILVFLLKNFLPGKFNISIEILFYIVFGIVFGPIKGPIFSILCDTTYQLFFGMIGFWMIEYAIVPPMISLTSWGLMFIYEKKTNLRFILPLIFLPLTIIGVIVFFVYQFVTNSFMFENSLINSNLVLGLMITLCILLFLTILITLILYHIKKKEIYVKILYLVSVVAIILIIFRWLWGPFAYILFFNRFLSTANDPIKIMATQYPITLAGIAMKTTIVLPIFVAILIPGLNAISFGKKHYLANRGTQ